jgi:hypothetical protein
MTNLRECSHIHLYLLVILQIVHAKAKGFKITHRYLLEFKYSLKTQKKL